MNLRAILTSNVPTAAVGAIVLGLTAASFGCAYAACYGVADPLLAAAPTARAAGPLAALPPTHGPVAEPMANVAEPVRCNAGTVGRARRGQGGLCRTVDMPPV